MDVRRNVERILDDEGLTDGLADAEASLLLAAMTDAVERELAGRSPEEADAQLEVIRRRGRVLGRIVAYVCYDDRRADAERLWRELGRTSLPESLEASDAAACLRRLLAAETWK